MSKPKRNFSPSKHFSIYDSISVVLGHVCIHNVNLPSESVTTNASDVTCVLKCTMIAHIIRKRMV